MAHGSGGWKAHEHSTSVFAASGEGLLCVMAWWRDGREEDLAEETGHKEQRGFPVAHPAPQERHRCTPRADSNISFKGDQPFSHPPQQSNQRQHSCATLRLSRFKEKAEPLGVGALSPLVPEAENALNCPGSWIRAALNSVRIQGSAQWTLEQFAFKIGHGKK